MSLLGPAITLLLLTQTVPPHEGRLESGQRFTLESDQQGYDATSGRFTAEGHAVLRTDGMVLRADHLVYDQKTQQAEATGNVLFVGELGAALANRIVLDLTTETAILDDAHFLQKVGVSPEVLAQVETPEQLYRTGTTQLALSAKSLQRLGPNELEVRSLSFTPCDCDPADPSWRIEATSANVIPGERVSLWWPVIYVGKAPLLALPYLYLPLSSRRTGLLFTTPSVSSKNGWSLEQPLFVTLGESYDATFTAGYFFGKNGPLGVKGPRLHTEFRYAPSEGTHGSIGLGLLHDLRRLRDPVNAELAMPGTKRGLRGDLRIDHTSNWWGARQRANLSLASDGYLPRDFETDLVVSQTQQLRSTLSVSKVVSGAYFGMHSVVRQDLRYGFGLVGDNARIVPAAVPETALRSELTNPRFFSPYVNTNVVPAPPNLVQDLAGYNYGPRTPSPRTMQELPSLHVYMPETAVGGPLRVGAHASYTRVAPLWGLHADEGADGIWSQTLPGPDPLQGDGDFTPLRDSILIGESEARDRFSARSSATLPLRLQALRVRPYVASNSDIWVGELTGTLDSRSYLVGGADLSTELSRVWGDALQGARHSVSPQLELRSVPTVVGDGVARPYDAVDAAVPNKGFTDAVIQIRQSLWLKRQGRVSELLTLDVGQGADLGTERLADAFTRLQLSLGTVTLRGTARYDVEVRALSLLSTRASWDSPKGHGLYLEYDNFLASGSDLQRRRLERLVGNNVHTGAERLQWITVGGRTTLFKGFTARYEMRLQPKARIPGDAEELKSNPNAVGPAITPIYRHGGVLQYTPNCNCWAVSVYAELQRELDPHAQSHTRTIGQAGLMLDVSGLGTVGRLGANL